MITKSSVSFILVFLFLMNITGIYSQIAMIKGGAIVLPPAFGVADVGFEFKINKTFSAQISYSGSKFGEYDHFNKTVLSLQSRCYLNGNEWYKSPFVGVVVQRLDIQNYAETYIAKGEIKYTSYQTNKQTLGVILGHNIKIYKGFGLDLHGGYVLQRGDETYELYNINFSAPKETLLKKNAVDKRFFWGLNLYLAINK